MPPPISPESHPMEAKLQNRPLSLATWVTPAVLLAFASLTVVAQEPAPAENTELAGLLDAARRYEIRLTRPNVPLKLREPSVLNFTNPQRNQERGSVFVWLHNDRPAAIGQ